MDWIKVTIYSKKDALEPLCEKLSELGITGFEIEDEEEFLSFLEENRKYWDYVDEDLLKEKKKESNVKIYVENTPEGLETLSGVKSLLVSLKEKDADNEWGRLCLETQGINEEDWANNWKKYFHPINVGEKVLIQPAWETLDKETDRIVFTVNPGMTFGTGTHHTTKLCIEQLEKYIDESSDVLDIGCGSGILSIISLLLGAKEAWATDIDPACEHVAKENALMNGVNTDIYHIYSGDILQEKKLFDEINERKYPVIVANIVADVIIALIPTVKKLISENGVFICSGIIEQRRDDVYSSLCENGAKIISETKSDCWVCMVCKF